MRNEYAHFNHYEWVEGRTGKICSPLGRKVANILGYVAGGIYNAPINHKKIEWDDPYCISLAWRGELANYDIPQLTMLFVRCTRELVRVSLEGIGPGYIRMRFWQRELREGGRTWQCLPDVETLVAWIDSDFGLDKPKLYGPNEIADLICSESAASPDGNNKLECLE